MTYKRLFPILTPSKSKFYHKYSQLKNSYILKIGELNTLNVLHQTKGMKDKLEIKSPWTMVYLDCIDDFIAEIKNALPLDHELQDHELFPGIKWSGRPIFIVDDATTGKNILINLEKRMRWKNTKSKIPTIKDFKDHKEVGKMIERDHALECSKYSKLEQSQNNSAEQMPDNSGS